VRERGTRMCTYSNSPMSGWDTLPPLWMTVVPELGFKTFVDDEMR
jgi:hypothetical protein